MSPNTWWHCGPHRIYCGSVDHPDVLQQLLPYLPAADLVLWDPLGGAAPAAGYELARRGRVAAVVTERHRLPALVAQVPVPYRTTLATLSLPPPAEGEPRRPEWTPVALFSPHELPEDLESVFLCEAACSQEPPEAEAHAALLRQQWLLEQWTPPGGIVLAPHLGRGAALLAAEASGRVCWGAQADPRECAALLRRWEGLTGQAAVPAPAGGSR